MTLYKRIIPLALLALLSACIELPEVADPVPTTDAGVDGGLPDSGTPDAGDSGVPADTTPPTITAASPVHDSTHIGTDTQFRFTFSEPMDVNSVQVSTAPTVAFSASAWSNGNTVLTLQPAAALAQNTAYTTAIDGKDVAGNPLTGRKVFSFSTTGPAPDTTPPTVLSATPGHGSIGVARNTSITVVFSEPMDKASAQTAFAITSPPGFNAGVFDWNATGTEMTFNPDAEIPYGTEVTWRVSTAARDLSTNTLEDSVASTFRVIRIATVTIDPDPATTGSAAAPDYWRQSSVYNFETVGDWELNSEKRLFLGFRLDALPEDLTLISHCTLKWYTTGQHGNPFGTLGRLLLERVYIGEAIALSHADWINPAAKPQYESAPLSPPIIIPGNTSSNTKTFNVTSFVSLDWQERNNRNTKRAQFRLRFEAATDNDSSEDSLYSDAEQTPKLAELEVTYEHP